jgi:hypothetical protein
VYAPDFLGRMRKIFFCSMTCSASATVRWHNPKLPPMHGVGGLSQ